METVRSGLRLVSSTVAHAAVGVGAGSVAAVSTVLPSTGGAVDIIAVRQPDGTLRCSPFYVRFGKYQGLIRGSEKVVTVTVNGVLSDFTMRLGRNGEAFFVDAAQTADGSGAAEDSDEDEATSARTPDPTRGGAPTTPADLDASSVSTEGDDADAAARASILPGESLDPTSPAPAPSPAPPRVAARATTTDAARLLERARSHSRSASLGGDVDLALGDLTLRDDHPDRDHLTLEELGQAAAALAVQEPRAGSNPDPDASPDEDPAVSVALVDAAPPTRRRATQNNLKSNGADPIKPETEPATATVPSTVPSTATPARDTTWGWLGWSGRGAGAPAEPPPASAASSVASETPRPPPSLEASFDDRGYQSDAGRPMGTASPGRSRRRSVDARDPPAIARLESSSASADIAAEIADADGRARGRVAEMDVATVANDSTGAAGGVDAFALLGVGGEGGEPRAVPRLELSTCGGNLAAFDDHVVDATAFLASPATFAADPSLAVRPWRPPGRPPAPPLPWNAAAPHLLAHLAFDAPLPASWRRSAGRCAGEGEGYAYAGAFGELSAAPSVSALEGESEGWLESDAWGQSRGTNARGRERWGEEISSTSAAASGSVSASGAPTRRASSTAGTTGSPSANHRARGMSDGMDGEGEVTSPRTNARTPRGAGGRGRKKIRRSVTLPSEQVARLGLRPGKNVIAFSFSTRVWGRQEVQAHAYLWEWNSKVVVSDVDGTITKSDVLGHLAPMVGKDWNHEGVAQLYNNIVDNGYRLMFLSSRAISQSKNTRRYLEKLTQDGETLTQGPIMLAPDSLSTALYREVVARRPQEFKMRCLRTIRDLFPPDWNPFYAGFGNRDTDVASYAHVGVPPGRNFTINPKSEVVAETTRMTKRYTLEGINELVDEMFPPVQREGRAEEYADSNYWRRTIPEIADDELP